METLARSYMSGKDVQHDEAFIRAYNKAVSRIGEPIYVYYHPRMNMLMSIYKGVSVQKILLTENNVSIPIEHWMKELGNIVRPMKLGLLVAKDLETAKRQNKRLKYNKLKSL